MKELIENINRLKKEKNAVILVHNYQKPEIYSVGDFIGDSLELSKEAARTDASIIVFCGVHFMAETAKILSPSKKVLLPSKEAGCQMADMATVDQLKDMKAKYPNAAVVSYVNTTADIKALTDVCCTSINAVKIVNSLDEDEIIFLPDENLGKYVQQHTNKKIILWPGHCYVHNNVLVSSVKKAKENYPNAKLVAHPECPPEVLSFADHICGTGGMIKYAKESDAKEFIIATEEGMINRLEIEVPNKKFYAVGGVCINMKKTTLQKVYDCLVNEEPEITIPEETLSKAKKALDKMINL
jgi:quinolinate synthase